MKLQNGYYSEFENFIVSRGAFDISREYRFGNLIWKMNRGENLDLQVVAELEMETIYAGFKDRSMRVAINREKKTARGFYLTAGSNPNQ